MQSSHLLIAALLIFPTGLHASTSSKTPSTTKSSTTTVGHSAMKPKIGEAEARATAIGRAPGGKVKSHELEQEHGKLIYSYDIEVSGKSGVTEVNVDAMTGKVLSVEHETPKTERNEQAKEMKAKKPDTTKSSAH